MKQRLKHPLITPGRLRRQAIIYLRQSTPGQVRENWGSTSLQFDQVELAREYGWATALIDVVDEDLGRSGAATGHRTGWQDMLRRIPSGTVGAVFALNVARLSRELRDFEELRILAKLYDVVLVIDGRPVDPADPNDTVLLQVQAAFAQHDNHERARALSRARREKARSGTVVSRLPLGWVKLPDGTYDFDPDLRAAIKDVPRVFWQMRSVVGTTRALAKAGRTLPVRDRGRIAWKSPTVWVVRAFLVNPAYAGFYVYGTTENRPELGPQKNGYPKRRRVPEDQWIKIPNHHPAYMTPEEQERIRAIMRSNRFERRDRPGRGSALAQGLLYCGQCGVRLNVQYSVRGRHRYECQKNLTSYARKRCFNILGPDLDEAIERIVLAKLEVPPVDLLRKALAEARAGELGHVQRIEVERKRLAQEEQLARDRYEHCDPRNRLVAADAEERLELAMQASIRFEQRLATMPARVSVEGTEDEVRQLCEVARHVPELWRHPLVTDHERKQILACLIERIPIRVGYETIEGHIRWRSGAETPFQLWRRPRVHQLVIEKHSQGLTVREIWAWLRTGDPTTGQSWTYTKGTVYGIISRAGLKPKSRHELRPEEREYLVRLWEEGYRAPTIAEKLREAGFDTPSRRAWTSHGVAYWLRRIIGDTASPSVEAKVRDGQTWTAS